MPSMSRVQFEVLALLVTFLVVGSSLGRPTADAAGLSWQFGTSIAPDVQTRIAKLLSASSLPPAFRTRIDNNL
jgi:hypothetical protein